MTFEDLSDFFQSKGVTVGNVSYCGDGTVILPLKKGSILVDIFKHHYYYLSNKEKEKYVKNVLEVLGL